MKDGDALMEKIIKESVTRIPAVEVRKKFLLTVMEAFEKLNWTGAHKLKGSDDAYDMALKKRHPECFQNDDVPLIGKSRSPKHKDITIPFGEKFKGEYLCKCPDWYLRWLRDQEWVEEKFLDIYEQAGIELEYRDRFPSERIGPRRNRKEG